MSDVTWQSDVPPPPAPAKGLLGWGLICLRVPLIACVLIAGLALMMLLRLVERPLCGLKRPVTPLITVVVCRLVLIVMGLRVETRGTHLQGPGAMVANHTTWLDIFVLNSLRTLYFVSKSEVASWPGIGTLARATGTLFIKRDRREAPAQTKIMEERLLAGHRLMFFPEGTSTDGLQVLRFRPTLFAAFLSERLRDRIAVQALSVTYQAPPGADPRFYGWWGDMEFGPSLLTILAQPRQGRVRVVFHPPVVVSELDDRKALASRLEAQVRAGHGTGLSES